MKKQTKVTILVVLAVLTIIFLLIASVLDSKANNAIVITKNYTLSNTEKMYFDAILNNEVIATYELTLTDKWRISGIDAYYETFNLYREYQIELMLVSIDQILSDVPHEIPLDHSPHKTNIHVLTDHDKTNEKEKVLYVVMDSSGIAEITINRTTEEYTINCEPYNEVSLCHQWWYTINNNVHNHKQDFLTLGIDSSIELVLPVYNVIDNVYAVHLPLYQFDGIPNKVYYIVFNDYDQFASLSFEHNSITDEWIVDEITQNGPNSKDLFNQYYDSLVDWSNNHIQTDLIHYYMIVLQQQIFLPIVIK